MRKRSGYIINPDETPTISQVPPRVEGGESRPLKQSMQSSFTQPISDVDRPVTSTAHWHGTRTQLSNRHFIPTTAVAFKPRCKRRGGDVFTASDGGEALALLVQLCTG